MIEPHHPNNFGNIQITMMNDKFLRSDNDSKMQ